MIALVWAMSSNRVIGRDGTMPWHLPADLSRFRQLTRGHVVVMGRRTYESIGGPLKDRVNIVVTRDRHYQAPGCTVLHDIGPLLADPRPLYLVGGDQSYQELLPHANVLSLSIEPMPNLLPDPRDLYVIGGAEVYREFLPHADVLHVTRIHAHISGDTFFPAYDERQWRLVEATERPRDEKNAFDCTFETYHRIAR